MTRPRTSNTTTPYYITTRPMYDYDAGAPVLQRQAVRRQPRDQAGRRILDPPRDLGLSAYPGNVYEQYNLNYPDIDPTRDGRPCTTPGCNSGNSASQYNLDWGVKQLTAFLQDTITTGRFNFLLGLRYDHQTPSINASTLRDRR